MSEGAAPNATRRRPDWAVLVIAAALIVLAAVVAVDASRLGGAASYARIGPQTVPYLIASCLAGLGVWTIIAAIRGDFPPREPQELRPVIWIVAGLLIQLALLVPVGFSIATGLMFGCVAYGLGRRPLWIGVPVGILIALVVWTAFARGLSLSLPGGPLESALTALLRGST